MHLLTAQAGGIEDGSQPVDLAQSPGDVVVLTSADTEIAGLSNAKAVLGDDVPSLRLANLLQLINNFSVDLYVEKTLSEAKLIVVRVLGGPGYWRYGLDELVRLARGRGIQLAVVSGAPYPDATLEAYCTLEADRCTRLWSYLVEGGPENFGNFLQYCQTIISDTPLVAPAPAVPLPNADIYWPGDDNAHLEDLPKHWIAGAPVAAIVFYRALVQGGDLAPIDALVSELASQSINALPVFVSSLKDPIAADRLKELFDEVHPDVVLNLTAFAVSKPSENWAGTPLDHADCPVFQVVLAGANEQAWRDNLQGLTARDIAMNVAMPEIDGRIITRAISFKSSAHHDQRTETGIVRHAPMGDRVRFVASLAGAWAKLRRSVPGERRIAIVLSNYPSSDGQIANGVGLDTPASAVTVMEALKSAGYPINNIPAHGGLLMDLLQAGPTNAGVKERDIRERLTRTEYLEVFRALPSVVQEQVEARWGGPEDDFFFVAEDDAFAIPALKFGDTVVAVQLGRGFGLNPKDAHHDLTIVPPHGYIAFYAWLREVYGAHAIVHLGKHGNLEWLPGKALALSEACYPEAVFGAVPHIYPFIVNDPGEGSQAKRRTSAVIIDHLTPPLTRAESYGPLKDLEALVDEYYEAAGVDARRVELLSSRIVDLAAATGLDKDCGIGDTDSETAALTKLDNFLCELKELQIRDGLHVFGREPEEPQLSTLLMALVRLPRDDGKGGKASLVRALASDLGLRTAEFDPLDCEMALAWQGARPDVLRALTGDQWRTAGDTVERLELLGLELVSGARPVDVNWPETGLVMQEVEAVVRPRLLSSGPAEIEALLKALDGRFVPPGPSGAPTRGRIDVLPTGRNFYSVDSRTIPTEAAWTLGFRSADLLITAYRQEHGAWPKQLAISAWGTSNMRTGGDDIAQALACLGVRPTWDKASRRITGYEIIGLSELQRPRVDVMFRISGFFRDAFPEQIDLLDTAIRAIATLNEPASANPIADRVNTDKLQLLSEGISEAEADLRAGQRIFGSRPGGYGAGLKDIVQSGNWADRSELAGSYLEASGYAYGFGASGEARHGDLEQLVARTDGVVHNQDNREFDLLDSADFFQFEGGLAAAVTHLTGTEPAIYHNDHSRPERPAVRRLGDEIARIIHGRAANPKWLAGVRRHGYKGASEMAATVTNLLGFAATTNAVQNRYFEKLYEAYLVDPKNREFLTQANPAALAEMSARFVEAFERGFWQPRRNSTHDFLHSLAKKDIADVCQAEQRTRPERQAQGEDAQAQGTA